MKGESKDSARHFREGGRASGEIPSRTPIILKTILWNVNLICMKWVANTQILITRHPVFGVCIISFEVTKGFVSSSPLKLQVKNG